MLGVSRMRAFGLPRAALIFLACACGDSGRSADGVPILLKITTMNDRNARMRGTDPPQDAKLKDRAKIAAPLFLAEKRVQCTLEPSSENPAEKAPTMPAVVKALEPGRKLFLVVGDLRTNVQPGVLYNLYLNLPEGASPREAEAHFAGRINFFNARVAENPKAAAKSSKFVSFDVTELAKTLAAQGKLKEKLVLTVIPDGEPVKTAKPMIGEIKVVEQ